jgi:hypothetical protein
LILDGIIHGSVATHTLTVEPAPNKRKRCRFCPKNAQKAATHHGRANGVTMTSGCEWHMRQWVRDTLAKRRAGLYAGSM